MIKKNWRKRKFLIKKKNTYKLLFLLILGMTLGFAAISTTLKFTGTVNVAKTTWDIHWENPKRLGGVSAIKDAALKDGDNTIVEYQVNLEDPGDYYEFTVKAVNSGTIDAMVTGVSNKVYDTNNVEQTPSYIDFNVTYGDGIAIEDNHKLKSGKSETYKVRVLYKEGLAADQFPATETTYKFVFQVTYAQEDETTSTDRGTNIIAWTYNEDSTAENYCINGEEATCKTTDCYKAGNTCEMGTVIKYKVNSTDYKYFYVLKDDGETITMQQRENTIRNIAWHAGENNNSQGPDTILPALEQATRNWTNVNTIEYTPGTAPFANTGCTFNSGTSGDYKPVCSTTTYTMSSRKARARMITLEEAGETGCLVYKNGAVDTRILGNSIDAYNNGSCPDWMHNYLYQSKNYGGSYEDNTQDENGTYNWDYWTMSAYSSNSTHAWLVYRSGYLGSDVTSNTKFGARAVVEISK